jgi:hypothetical protein
MSGFVQALRAYRDGTLSKEKLLTEVERQLAMRETDAVALMRLLNEEHARSQLSDSVHGLLSTRIMSWCAPQGPTAEPLTESDPIQSGAPFDRTATVVIDHGLSEDAAGAGPGTRPEVDSLEHSGRRTAPITLGSVLQGRFKLIESIGHGGMSVVYKAIDLRKVETRSANPYVAVKILTVPSSGFGQSLALLQGEATVMAARSS